MCAAVRGLREEDGRRVISVTRICKAAPGDVNSGRVARRNAGVDRDHGALMFRIRNARRLIILAQYRCGTPCRATIQRSAEINRRALKRSVPDEGGIGHVDWCSGDRLGYGFPIFLNGD